MKNIEYTLRENKRAQDEYLIENCGNACVIHEICEWTLTFDVNTSHSVTHRDDITRLTNRELVNRFSRQRFHCVDLHRVRLDNGDRLVYVDESVNTGVLCKLERLHVHWTSTYTRNAHICIHLYVHTRTRMM